MLYEFISTQTFYKLLLFFAVVSLTTIYILVSVSLSAKTDTCLLQYFWFKKKSIVTQSVSVLVRMIHRASINSCYFHLSCANAS